MYNKHIFHEVVQTKTTFDVAILVASGVFVMALLVAAGISVSFKNEFRAKVKAKWAFPILGLLMLIIPVTEDYLLLVKQGQIDELFSNYIAKGDTLVKLSIYVTAFNLIFGRKTLMAASAPLTLLMIGLGLFSKTEAHYLYHVIEYSLVVAGLIFALVLKGKRYSFINFIDSLILGALLVGSVLVSRFFSTESIEELKAVKVNSFNTFFDYDGGWEQVATWAAIMVSFLFVYLFVNTMVSLRTNVAETFALIRLEDKYRKANIEFEIEADSFSVEALLTQKEEKTLDLEKMIKEEPKEYVDEKSIELREVFIKSKGIRSPAF